ncbi:hypothetical protein U9M48_027646 [Paspalum notatum var. saurae]|uniref:Uncharacterized protein n=1 Tax=Paspalum notatum var. saurae TaxID=547442 RepID=A0AAQ3TZV1_PASNO
MGCCHHKEQDLPLCSLIRALMCTMEDVPTAAPAVHNVKDTMEDAPINTDMSRSPFCPPSSPIDVVPIVAVEFFMAAPNSQDSPTAVNGNCVPHQFTHLIVESFHYSVYLILEHTPAKLFGHWCSNEKNMSIAVRCH